MAEFEVMTDGSHSMPQATTNEPLSPMQITSGRRLRTLLISRSLPYPPRGGAIQRTNLIHRCLKEFGDVDVFIVGEIRDRPDLAEEAKQYNMLGATQLYPRGKWGFWRLLRPLSPSKIDFVAKAFGRRAVDYLPDPYVSATVADLMKRNSYDLVFGRYLRPTAQAGAIGHVPTVIDIDDVDVDLYRTRMNQPGINPFHRAVFRSHYRQTQRILDRMLPTVDSLIVAKEEDVDRVHHPRTHLVPNLPYDIVENPQGDFQEPTPDSKLVLFVGTFAHRVNREGVVRFVNTCWPAIRAAVPDARFRVVGGGRWETIVPSLTCRDGVEIVGFVHSLTEAYRECALTVAPLFEGGGTKIKVLESLYYGRVPLVTDHAAQGFQTLADRGGLQIAQTEEQLIRGVIDLLGAPERREQMARVGHKAVLAEFGFERFRGPVLEAVRDALTAGESRLARSE